MLPTKPSKLIRIITFWDNILKESWFSVSYDYVSNWYSKNFSIEVFKTCFICHYCPEAIMKKFAQLTCTVIGSEALDDEPMFSGIAHSQERWSFACKQRQTEDTKTKVFIFVYKIFTSSFFKRYTTISMWCRTLAKWSYCKVKPLQNEAIAKWRRFFLSSTIW